MREVCSYLKSNVKTRYISVYSLESKIPNIYSIVYKQGMDLVLTVNNTILYTPVIIDIYIVLLPFCITQ